MDFWKIVGIVFLLCTIINLPYFVMELREDKQKKRAEEKKPAQPMEPPKQSKQEEKKPQSVKTEPQKERLPVRETVSEKTEQQEPIQRQEKQIPAQETPAEKKEEPAIRRDTSIMTNEELVQFSEECIQKITTRKYESMEEALRAVALEGIEEPEYDVIFSIYCDTCGHDGRTYTCGGRYHYDQSGILRKLYRRGIGFMIGDDLKQPGRNTDCYVYDDRGRLLRAVEHGWPSGNGSVFFDFYAFCYEPDDSGVVPLWGIRKLMKLMPTKEGYVIDGKQWRVDAVPQTPRTPAFSWWCNPEEWKQENCSVRVYDSSEPSDKEINGYRILKASPEQTEKLIRCFEERKSEYFEEPEVFTGECGDGMTWKQVDDVLYIQGEGEIEERAFFWDASIRKVVIAPGCTEIGEYAFCHCEQLREVELPEGLLRIGTEAFSECEALAVITLPDGLQEIGENAFSWCNHHDLKLHIPDSVTEIGKDAFEDVPEIVYCGPAWDEVDWLAEKWVNIHEVCDGGNWKIKDNTLYVYVNGELPLKEFEVRSIHHRFSETEIRSPWDSYNDRFEHVFIAPGCTKIPRDSFCYCRNLKTISIPDTVKGIEEYAFYGCKRLTSIEIPDSVTEIGDNAFEDIPCIIYNGPAQSDDNWGAKSWN